jgi:hypothetical protein
MWLFSKISFADISQAGAITSSENRLTMEMFSLLVHPRENYNAGKTCL